MKKIYISPDLNLIKQQTSVFCKEVTVSSESMKIHNLEDYEDDEEADNTITEEDDDVPLHCYV